MKDETKTTIMGVLEYMKSLPHQQAIAFAEELIFAVSLESGSKNESLGILRWADNSIIKAYEHQGEEEVSRDFYVDKAIAGN